MQLNCHPEPEVIEISEEEEDPAAVDPDLQKAISESLKDTRKRNGEGGTSAEGEPKRPKLACPASADVDEAFDGLLDELRSKIASADEFERVREGSMSSEQMFEICQQVIKVNSLTEQITN